MVLFFGYVFIRIYIKKVRKFPTYAVKLDQDKKSIRLAMDKAFHELREQGLDAWGEERLDMYFFLVCQFNVY